MFLTVKAIFRMPRFVFLQPFFASIVGGRWIFVWKVTYSTRFV